jgi:predicted nucleic-acid-binding Zn-ribbon protein
MVAPCASNPEQLPRNFVMKRTNKCPKCDSTDVIADAKAIDRSHHSNQTEFTVATFRKPDAVLFKGQQNSTVSAWVCAECGFVEFYADSPQSLKIAKT